jgi:hypothetical protein
MATTYNRNRAVHLARRDALFEKARDMLLECCSHQEKIKKYKAINSLLYLLRSAYEYAFLARKSTKSDSDEDLLLHFLRSILQLSLALKVMLKIELDFTKPSSPLSLFLNAANSSENSGETGSNPLNTSFLSEAMLEKLKNFIKKSEGSFAAIKEKNRKALTDAEVEKYQRSWKSVEEMLTTTKLPSNSFSAEPLIPFSK